MPGGIYDLSGKELKETYNRLAQYESSSEQFLNGRGDTINNFTLPGSQVISGSLDVLGTLTANKLIASESIIEQTGSTRWGDTLDNTHQFTGSLSISGSLKSSPLVVTVSQVGIGTDSPDEMLTVSGNIKSTEYITGKKSGVYAYLSQSTTTQMPTAETFYALSGSFVNVPMEDFHLGTDAIVYDGTKTQYFEIDFHATLAGNATGTTVVLGVKKNGVLCPGSQMGAYLKTAGEFYVGGGTCVTELSQSDTIQLVGKSSATSEQITFHYYTTTISEFFD